LKYTFAVTVTASY